MSVSILSRPSMAHGERLMAERDAALARIAELEARLAEEQLAHRGVVAFGPLVVSPKQMIAHLDGRRLDLTPIEWRLLNHLAQRAGTICTHRDILAAVWGPAYVEDRHLLVVNICRLRAKLQPYPGLIETRPNVGFMMPDPDSVGLDPLPFFPPVCVPTYRPVQDAVATRLAASAGEWVPVHRLRDGLSEDGPRRRESRIREVLSGLARRCPDVELLRVEGQIVAAKLCPTVEAEDA